MADELLTPSKIAAWLDCDHYLTLSNQVSAGSLKVENTFGEMAQMLLAKGLEHEEACLQFYRDQGMTVFEVDERQKGESFSDWVARIGEDPFNGDPDVIFQMPFIHDGIRGIADFLIKTESLDGGPATYEPLDAKLARKEAKPSHILQLCFYAESLQELNGRCGENLHVWLGSGEIETHRVASFVHYWRRLRSQLKTLLADTNPDLETKPEPCSYCALCQFNNVCEAEWREADSLVYVAGVRKAEREVLEADRVETLALLATREAPVAEMSNERLQRISKQAELQKSYETKEGPPPFELIEPGEDPVWGRGFEQLPEPNEGDIFLDYEGHPFWSAKTELFFLLGFIAKDDGSWGFNAFWAHSTDEEREATRNLIDYLVDRRQQFPDMHVYHYNHTERSALERLVEKHELDARALNQLIAEGLFVDLFTIARNAVQVGTESYGLKHLELVAGYERSHDIDAGAGAVLEYDTFMKDGLSERLDRIARYNEDDVRATMALRDWMIAERPADDPWRDSILELGYEPDEDLEDRVAALHSFEPDTPEHLLGDLLGYWGREYQAFIVPKLAYLAEDNDSLLEVPDVISGLTPTGLVERFGAKGQPITPFMAFSYPEQTIDTGFEKPTASGVFVEPDGPPGYLGIGHFDRDAGELHLAWNEKAQERGVFPTSIALHDWVYAEPKPSSVNELADRVLDSGANGEPNPVSLALLAGDMPAFTPGYGPKDGIFDDDPESILSWVEHLDNSYVAVQGPPGTGKTYRGARAVHALVLAGKRVGITAMSHGAIDNLLEEVVEVFEENGDLSKLNAVRKKTADDNDQLQRVDYVGTNAPCARPEFNVVAGTTWLFSNDDMAASPVDVLIVDEAGQLSLADALAASRSAKNMILLGDPLQLAQVSQASHPGVSGASVLEHVLAGKPTIESNRGVFLSETRRMHPDVCTFISEQIYEGRLSAHPTCEIQTTEFGTGLRWLEASHTNCRTESPEEAETVAAQIQKMIGSKWTDQQGVESALIAADFMVVAPYNDQVSVIRGRLDSSPSTAGVSVGTVDKFQGREAPVVFYTMTSSDASQIKRGPDFLFSQNRLNVAVSRARCLAYLVCTEELLNTRSADVQGMKLLSTLCAFEERAS